MSVAMTLDVASQCLTPVICHVLILCLLFASTLCFFLSWLSYLHVSLCDFSSETAVTLI